MLCAINLSGVDTGAGMVADSQSDASIFSADLAFSQTLTLAAPALVFGGIALARPPGPASFTPDAGVIELADGTASGSAASRYFAGYRREIDGAYGFGATSTQASAGALVAVAFKGV